MVEDGFGDFCFEIGKNEIWFVKNIISSCNNELKRLISKSKNNRIKVSDLFVTKESIINLLIYYGDGTIEINDKNVVEMFYACLVFKENILKSYLENYIKYHCSIKIMKRLLDILSSIDSNELMNINKIAQNYLQLNGYKLFSENEMNSLSFNCISYIFHIPNLIIKSENYLLKKLIMHYNYSKRQIEKNDSFSYSPTKRNKNDLYEKYKILFDLLNWEKISLTEFNKSEIEMIKYVLKEIEESKKKRNYEMIKINRIYIDPIRSGNEQLDESLLKCVKLYQLQSLIKISDEEKYSLLSVRKLNDIISSILMDNNNTTDLLYQIICLIINSDLNLNIKSISIFSFYLFS